MKNSKIEGTYTCQTMDWSAEEMAVAINEQQEAAGQKLILTGGQVEVDGEEHQVLLFSKVQLDDEDVKAELAQIEEELTEDEEDEEGEDEEE